MGAKDRQHGKPGRMTAKIGRYIAHPDPAIEIKVDGFKRTTRQVLANMVPPPPPRRLQPCEVGARNEVEHEYFAGDCDFVIGSSGNRFLIFCQRALAVAP